MWRAHSGDGSTHSITIATRASYHCPHADNILSWKSNCSAMGALTYQEKHLEKYPLWYLLPIVLPFRTKVWSICMWLANSRSQSWALDQGQCNKSSFQLSHLRSVVHNIENALYRRKLLKMWYMAKGKKQMFMTLYSQHLEQCQSHLEHSVKVAV